MKTDFINNMTHEFKTPIATIDLAINAVKNEKVKNNSQLVKKYLNIIGEENKRMNFQVENVLKISQLENKKIDLNKDINIHSVIHEANDRISLLLNTNNGKINLDLKAENSIFKLSFENLLKFLLIF